MSRRRMTMDDRSELPSGYTRCEYLQGLGTEKTYIVIPQIDITNKPIVKFEVAYPKYTSDTNAFGSITNSVRFEHGIGWSGKGFSYNYGHGYGGENAQIIEYGKKKEISANALYDTRSMFEYSNDSFWLNGVEQTLSRSSKYADGEYGVANEVFIFGTNRGDTVRFFCGKIYSFYVENQVNLIPALDPSGRPCMYDTVTQKPFYNSGTGEFLYKVRGL